MNSKKNKGFEIYDTYFDPRVKSLYDYIKIYDVHCFW
jgi:hypothetical protein